MSHIARFVTLAVLLAGASSALGGCQAIAGIDDRPYVPAASAAGAGAESGAAGSGPEASPACVEYCNKANDDCRTDLQGNVQESGVLYLSNEACLAACAQMPLLGADQNSVACRVRQLDVDLKTGEDVQHTCANAGPGGNGACGSNCENYCRLFKAACTDEFQKYADDAAEGDDGTAVCVGKCLGLEDTGLFDSTMSGNYLGDTLQCRLVHTCSSLLDPVTHCPHAELKSAAKCLDDPKAAPDCAKFCHLEMVECADYPMYESDAQCQAVCKALPRGTNGDQTQNTVGCRMYHSYNSLLDPKTHCSHTAPGGDGHCVSGDDATPDPDTGNCQSYCGLFEKACKDAFDADFDSQSACEDDCQKLDGAAHDSGYTTNAKGNNVQCRLLHVSRALSDPKECGAAEGAAPCK